MRAFISISKSTQEFRSIAAVLAALCGVLFVPGLAQSEETKAESKTLKPEEEDFSHSPYTEYGEFNEQREEDELTRFFQYGRFFGVSIGSGFSGVTGNRGALYQGGAPLYDFKIHYWFDFNFALQFGFSSATHFLESSSLGHVDVTLVRAGADFKYYLPTKDLSAAVSFSNPYLLLGALNVTKTDSNAQEGTVENDAGLGFTAGAGLEFVVSPGKTYFTLEGKYQLVTFKDTFTTEFRSDSTPVADLTGDFFLVTASLLFTW